MPKVKPTVAMEIGSIIHTLILEGHEAFKDAYFMVGDDEGPINERTGKLYGRGTVKFENWVHENAEGRTIITPLELAMADALTEHPEIKQLFMQAGISEMTIRTEIEGQDVQVRPDRICRIDGRLTIIELKKCADINWFSNDYRNLGYQYQNALYRSVVSMVSGEDVDVVVVAVESSEVPRCGMWAVESGYLHDYAQDNIDLIRKIDDCSAFGIWPSGHLVGVGVFNGETVGRPRFNE